MSTPYLTTEQISVLSDERLLCIIRSGDSINWDILFPGESISTLDEYMMELFSEKERRQL